jgi:hypothetical protein
MKGGGEIWEEAKMPTIHMQNMMTMTIKQQIANLMLLPTYLLAF